MNKLESLNLRTTLMLTMAAIILITTLIALLSRNEVIKESVPVSPIPVTENKSVSMSSPVKPAPVRNPFQLSTQEENTIPDDAKERGVANEDIKPELVKPEDQVTPLQAIPTRELDEIYRAQRSPGALGLPPGPGRKAQSFY